MKKRLQVVLVALVCAFAIALAACGGGSGGSAGGSGGGSGDAVVQVDPSEKFIGTWKIAALKTQGITMVGNFADILNIAGMASEDIDTSQIDTSEGVLALTIAEGGTGSINYLGNTVNLTWELSNDDTLVATLERTDTSESSEAPLGDTDTVSFVYQDDALVATLPMEEQEATMTFTADGKLADIQAIDLSKATAVTSADELTGTWQMGALCMMGVTAYADPASLAQMYSGGESDVDMSLVFGDDGSVTFMGTDAALVIDDDGAKIDMTYLQLPITQIDDMLVIDMGGLFGVDMAFGYTK